MLASAPVETVAICICMAYAIPPYRGYIKTSGSTDFPVAYLVPCVRLNDIVQSLMSGICVPAFPRYLAGFTGSLKLLASLLQRRDFLCSTVTSQTDLSGFLYHCNTRYDWLVRPCSTGSFTLQETPSLLGAPTAGVIRMSLLGTRQARILGVRFHRRGRVWGGSVWVVRLPVWDRLEKD